MDLYNEYARTTAPIIDRVRDTKILVLITVFGAALWLTLERPEGSRNLVLALVATCALSACIALFYVGYRAHVVRNLLRDSAHQDPHSQSTFYNLSDQADWAVFGVLEAATLTLKNPGLNARVFVHSDDDKEASTTLWAVDSALGTPRHLRRKTILICVSVLKLAPQIENGLGLTALAGYINEPWKSAQELYGEPHEHDEE